MSSKRTFYLLCGVFGLVLLGLFGATYMANSMISKQADTLKNQRLQTQTLDAEATALAKAKKDVQKYADLAVIAKSIVPQDKDQAQTVREIVNIAAKQGISIGSITFPTSSLGNTPGVVSPGTAAKSQLAPVKDIPGVYFLQVTVQSNGSATVPYNRFISFLNALEHNRRTALVSAITLTPDSKNSNNVSFTLTLDEYLKP
jgi:hypothetical protein